jgi:hypothetical protein
MVYIYYFPDFLMILFIVQYWGEQKAHELTLNKELDIVIDHLNVMLWHLPRRTKEKCNNSQPSQPGTLQKFELITSWIHVQSASRAVLWLLLHLCIFHLNLLEFYPWRFNIVFRTHHLCVFAIDIIYIIYKTNTCTSNLHNNTISFTLTWVGIPLASSGSLYTKILK